MSFFYPKLHIGQAPNRQTLPLTMDALLQRKRLPHSLPSPPILVSSSLL
jgi:hypothetical protein